MFQTSKEAGMWGKQGCGHIVRVIVRHGFLYTKSSDIPAFPVSPLNLFPNVAPFQSSHTELQRLQGNWKGVRLGHPDMCPTFGLPYFRFVHLRKMVNAWRCPPRPVRFWLALRYVLCFGLP